MAKNLSQEVERLARIVERMTAPVATVHPPHQQENIDAAIALAKTASETATALAKAKTDSDIASAKSKAEADLASALMGKDLTSIKEDISEIKEVLKNQDINYVNITEYKEHLKRDDDHEARLRALEKEAEDHALVKKVVYGAVGFILLAVLSAIVFLVVKR